jgi:hypothetical protein
MLDIPDSAFGYLEDERGVEHSIGRFKLFRVSNVLDSTDGTDRWDSALEGGKISHETGAVTCERPQPPNLMNCVGSAGNIGMSIYAN